jgi:hypothetical protein
MKKLMLAALVLGVGAYFGYAKILRPAPKRACARAHQLCGEQMRDDGDDKNDCTEFFDAIRNNSSDADANKTAQCVLDAKSCPEAMGCMAGGGVKLGAGAAKGFLEGLQKSVK